ncbi:unnamed protein product [Meloidogyne enterolobii]|uniref:Uncharacterized protein n=1 Tax=Meloidogyne enterolobii TaxID=390850 RepID=A0ACB1AX96_MELEN
MPSSSFPSLFLLILALINPTRSQLNAQLQAPSAFSALPLNQAVSLKIFSLAGKAQGRERHQRPLKNLKVGWCSGIIFKFESEGTWVRPLLAEIIF